MIGKRLLIAMATAVLVVAFAGYSHARKKKAEHDGRFWATTCWSKLRLLGTDKPTQQQLWDCCDDSYKTCRSEGKSHGFCDEEKDTCYLASNKLAKLKLKQIREGAILRPGNGHGRVLTDPGRTGSRMPGGLIDPRKGSSARTPPRADSRSGSPLAGSRHSRAQRLQKGRRSTAANREAARATRPTVRRDRSARRRDFRETRAPRRRDFRETRESRRRDFRSAADRRRQVPARYDLNRDGKLDASERKRRLELLERRAGQRRRGR